MLMHYQQTVVSSRSMVSSRNGRAVSKQLLGDAADLQTSKCTAAHSTCHLVQAPWVTSD